MISDDSDEPKSVDSNESGELWDCTFENPNLSKSNKNDHLLIVDISVDQSEIFIRDIIDLANRYHIVPVKPDSTKPIEKGTEPSISASSSSASTKIPETTSEHTSSNILLPKPVDAPTKNPAVTESPSINEKISEE